MEEGGKVRVVRCPKCQKLLAELPDIPVYRCGGCDATLQAKNQLTAKTDVSLEKSNEEKVRSCENSEICSGKGGIVLNQMSETERESDSAQIRGKERILPEGLVNSISSSSSVSGNRDVLNDYSGSGGFEPEPSRYGGGRYRRPSKAPVENLVDTNNLDPNSDEFMRTNMKGSGESNTPIENTSVFRKSRQMPDRWEGEREGSLALRRERRTAAEGSRFCPYPDEGPSNHRNLPAYENGEQFKNQYLDGSDRVETLEKDRVELLRRLDELRDQLSRSCDISDQQRERGPAHGRMVTPHSYDHREAWFAEGLPPANGSSSQFYPPDNPIPRPVYVDNEPHVPLMGRHDIDVHTRNEILGHRDTFGHQVPRRGPNPHNHYPQRPSSDYFSGQYVETDPDPVIPYPPHAFYEQPPCSCLHCYNKHWQVPGQVAPSVFCNRQLPSAAVTNQMFYHFKNPSVFGPGAYNNRGANSLLRSREPHRHARRLSDLELDMGGFRRSQPQKSVFAKGNQRTCQPILNGAPFITCCNCFVLLQFPQRLSLTEKNSCKMRCGACSNVILFNFDGKRLVFSFASQSRDLDLPLDVDNDLHGVIKEGLQLESYVAERTISSSSDGYDSSRYKIESIDAKPVSSPPFDDPIKKVNLMNLSESEKRQGPSSPSMSSEDEEGPESMIVRREVSNSLEQHLKAEAAGSPLHKHSDYSPTNQVMNKFEKGSRSKRSNQEKVFLTKGTTRQSSVKDVAVATEMDCSYNEYYGISQDSFEATKDEDQHKFNKSSESFFAGLIKKSFKDFGRSNQSDNDQPNVSVNGHPLPDRIVKKAEKKAGRIHPGQYWYDYQAGFWGVMGHQCLGIIPSFIEEFNYPMPKNCSCGDTGVFVNARELHQKDLDLLAGRGLPTTRDKSYIIEISGRVFDEATGEELEGLGKLAPTVEKVKHGFGMRIPRSIA